MEMTVVATHAGRVLEVLVAGSTHVDAGAPLVSVEPRVLDGAPAPQAPRISIGASTAASDPGAHLRARRHLDALRSLIMGFDVTADEARRLVGAFQQERSQLPSDDPALLHGELEILTIFADLAELSRNLPAAEREEIDEEEGERVRSPREPFRSYLHSLDVEREGLPERFVARLARALAHYGVGELERGPELEEAVYRIFLAHQRAPSQVPTVMALLDRRLQDAESLPERLRDDFHETLDRLIVATQLRYAAVGELARSVRFRAFDQPVIESTRTRVLATGREQLRYLAAHPDAPDHSERIEALVASPEPLIRLLSERIGGREGHGPLLELLTRRYYKICELEDVRSLRRGGRQFVTARYSLEGRRLQLITTLAETSELLEAASAVAALASEAPDLESVVDFYLHWSGVPPDGDSMAAELSGALNGADLPPTVLRVTTAVSGPAGAPVRHLTFRPAEGGFHEERVTRDLHPMIARLLHLWRLANFDVTRLPAVEDVHLFHCAARENPSDERLVALAEVRDVTPVRDASRPAHRAARARAGSVGMPRRHPPRPGPAPAQPAAAGKPRAPLRMAVDRGTARRASRGDTDAGSEHGRAGPGGGVDRGARPCPPGGELRNTAIGFSYQPGVGVTLSVAEPPTEPLPTLDEYAQKALGARRRGTVYPYELVPVLTRAGGTFTEYDLDDHGRLVPVDASLRREQRRDRRRRRAHDHRPLSRGHGARRDLRRPHQGARRDRRARVPSRHGGHSTSPTSMNVPVEWLAVSAGAKISMESGTENMDWISRVLRRLVKFTQARGEVNVIVAGINVGAQPYWNAEATMLHAHPRHPRDDARQRDGAHRQAGARLLGRRLGRGQPRDRRLRPGHGPERPGPVLGGRPGRGLRDPLRPLRAHAMWRRASASPAARPRTDPVDRDVRTYPHHAAAATSRPWATSSRRRRTPSARSPSTSAR